MLKLYFFMSGTVFVLAKRSVLFGVYFLVLFLNKLKWNQQTYWCFDTWVCFPNLTPAKDPFWVQVAYWSFVVKAHLYFAANSTQGSNMAGSTSVCRFFFSAWMKSYLFTARITAGRLGTCPDKGLTLYIHSGMLQLLPCC